MSFPLITHLIENLDRTVNSLTGTSAFQAIAKADPAFAQKLQTAWEGDAMDFARNGTSDGLFLKLLENNALQRFAPGIGNSPESAKVVQLLRQLFITSFPNKAAPTANTDNRWGHERFARESIQHTKAYRMLKEELK